ncbi:MAG: hypothetical protein K8T89_08140 [Planctomycetes bacterium]|nr:hypothetical protein [Planctomycetota bacterium]
MSLTITSPHLHTRQQLDELDSLLQKMLALPLSAEPARPVSAPTSPEAFAPLPPTLPQPAPLPRFDTEQVMQIWKREVPLPEASAPQPSIVPPFAISVESPAPPLVVETLPNAVPYAMLYGHDTGNPAAPAYAEPVPSSFAPVGYRAPIWAKPAREHDEPTSLLAWPIVLLNRVFDAFSYLLGPLGTWFRMPSGRNFLGWTGVLMILGAIGLGVAGWYGVDWTP